MRSVRLPLLVLSPALFSCVALLSLAACNRSEPPELKPWVRPAPRPVADGSCAALASSHPTATWQRAVASLDLPVAGPLVIADASVLGGPFHAPVVIADVPAGAHAIDVLTGPTRAGAAHPLCAVVHLREGEASSWKPLGDVPVDTDVVAIADQRRFASATRATLGAVVAGVQLEAAELPAVLRELAVAGIPVEQVLPTLLITTRPVQPGDRSAIGEALKRAHAYGHYVEEPATSGWSLAKTLGDRPAAAVDLGVEKRVAVVVEAGEGDGAYVVAAGSAAEGAAPVVIELRLSPLLRVSCCVSCA